MKRNSKFKRNIKLDSWLCRCCRYGSIGDFGTFVFQFFANSLRVAGCYFLEALFMIRSNYPWSEFVFGRDFLSTICQLTNCTRFEDGAIDSWFL